MSEEESRTVYTSEYLESRIPGLEVGEVLGIGGMGAVHKARQKNLDREAALKILGAEWQGEEGMREMFQREARAMAKLSHPNLVGVYDFGFLEDEGAAYLLMEYVHGDDLHNIAQQGTVDPKKVAAILVQVAAGLGYAHSEGVVHLDIKPANIMITTQGQAKLLDFGLANIANEAGQISGDTPNFGTPDYAAPEMFGDNPTPDQRSDIYAMGAVLYELLTGAAPQGQYQRASELSGCDRAYDDVVNTCLKPDPSERFQSMAEFSQELAAVAQGKGKASVGLVTAPGTTSTSEAAGATKESSARANAAFLEQQEKERKMGAIKVAMMIVGTLVVTLVGLGFAWKVYSDKQATDRRAEIAAEQQQERQEQQQPEPREVTAATPEPEPEPEPQPELATNDTEPTPAPDPEPTPTPLDPEPIPSSPIPSIDFGRVAGSSAANGGNLPSVRSDKFPDGLPLNRDPWKLEVSLPEGWPRPRPSGAYAVADLGGDRGIGLFLVLKNDEPHLVLAAHDKNSNTKIVQSAPVDEGQAAIATVLYTSSHQSGTGTLSLQVGDGEPMSTFFSARALIGTWDKDGDQNNGFGREIPENHHAIGGVKALTASGLGIRPNLIQVLDSDITWILSLEGEGGEVSEVTPMAPDPSPDPDPTPGDAAALLPDATTTELPAEGDKGILVATSATDGATLPTNMGAAFDGGQHVNPNTDAWQIDFAFVAPELDDCPPGSIRALMDFGNIHKGIGVFLVNRGDGPEVLLSGGIETARGSGSFFQVQAIQPGQPTTASVRHFPFAGAGTPAGTISIIVNGADEQSSPFQHQLGWIGSVISNGFGAGIPKEPEQIGGFAPLFADPLNLPKIDVDAFDGRILWALYARPAE